MKHEDRRAGEVAAMIFNANCDRKEYPNGITWLEIFPGWKELKVQTDDEMFENMMLWTKIEQPPI